MVQKKEQGHLKWNIMGARFRAEKPQHLGAQRSVVELGYQVAYITLRHNRSQSLSSAAFTTFEVSVHP